MFIEIECEKELPQGKQKRLININHIAHIEVLTDMLVIHTTCGYRHITLEPERSVLLSIENAVMKYALWSKTK